MYTKKPKNSIAASSVVTTPSYTVPRNKAEDATNKGTSISTKSLVDTIFLPTTAASPATSKMLAIFEPTALETTISVCPANMAAKEDATSGKEVPTPTIKAPITKEGIPKYRPIFSAP